MPRGLNSVAAAVRVRGDVEDWIIRLENLQVQSKGTGDDAVYSARECGGCDF